ncbi:MAG: TGS domain-containing protein [Candidatus Bathyarchaeota archaeon]|nr:TGS domain-containing protein [Candidatus Bathyarchaeum tardum]WGM88560.1 MAG: TGS domain-containing protein [Candidatus Bathyarchaeum tardum]WNZ29173.1 MAG: TGS domain-containing protein [Candidatus Bathyarchaeota archaeon]
MPANLPAEAKNKYREASLARKPEEKIKKLQEFMSMFPKHKGTENLRAQVKRKISLLKKEIEEKKQKKTGSATGPKVFIEKEGDSQIVLLGPTNVGRSSLLSTLTNSKVAILNYPYTTTEPTPGMFHYKDLQLQMVETPAIMEGSSEGGAWGLQTLTSARNADGLVLMVDLSQDPVEQLSLILSELEKSKILTKRPKARIEIEKKHMGAKLKFIVLGKLIDCTVKDLTQLLKSYGIRDATIKIWGEATLDDIEEAVFERKVYRPAIIIANKSDHPLAAERLELLKKKVGNKMKVIGVSCVTKEGIKDLGSEIFGMLDIIRVYTKEPNKKDASPRPFTIKKGSTVYDLAKRIHSDFYEQFSYAKIWGKRLRFSPQKVGGSFVLEDGDTIELHIK